MSTPAERFYASPELLALTVQWLTREEVLGVAPLEREFFETIIIPALYRTISSDPFGPRLKRNPQKYDKVVRRIGRNRFGDVPRTDKVVNAESIRQIRAIYPNLEYLSIGTQMPCPPEPYPDPNVFTSVTLLPPWRRLVVSHVTVDLTTLPKPTVTLLISANHNMIDKIDKKVAAEKRAQDWEGYEIVIEIAQSMCRVFNEPEDDDGISIGEAQELDERVCSIDFDWRSVTLGHIGELCASQLSLGSTAIRSVKGSACIPFDLAEFKSFANLAGYPLESFSMLHGEEALGAGIHLRDLPKVATTIRAKMPKLRTLRLSLRSSDSWYTNFPSEELTGQPASQTPSADFDGNIERISILWLRDSPDSQIPVGALMQLGKVLATLGTPACTYFLLSGQFGKEQRFLRDFIRWYKALIPSRLAFVRSARLEDLQVTDADYSHIQALTFEADGTIRLPDSDSLFDTRLSYLQDQKRFNNWHGELKNMLELIESDCNEFREKWFLYGDCDEVIGDLPDTTYVPVIDDGKARTALLQERWKTASLLKENTALRTAALDRSTELKEVIAERDRLQRRIQESLGTSEPP